MADALPAIDPDDLAELARLPRGLLAETASFANKCGYRLDVFLETAIDPELMLGFWLSAREDSESPTPDEGDEESDALG